MNAAAERPNQQLNPQTEASRRPDGLILQPPLNPSGLPTLGFLAHASFGKLPAWDRQANLTGGLAQMYFGTGPILWKIWVQVSSSLLSPLKHIVKLIE